MAIEAAEETGPTNDDNWSLRGARRQAQAHAKQQTSHRRLVVLLLVLALVLAGAYFARERILRSALPSPPVPPVHTVAPSHGPSKTSAMLTSVQRSLGEKTAELQLAGRVEVGAKTVRVSGSGVVDFATHQAKLSLSYPGRRILGGRAIRVIATGGRSYVSVPGLSKYLAGKKWISVATSEGVAPGSSNPTAFLSALEARGAVVRVISPKRVGGTEAAGYAVSFPARALTALLRTDPAVSSALSGLRSLDVTVYIARSTGLLLEADSTFTESLAGQLLSGESNLRLSHYGLQADFSPPPPATVTTMKAFLSKATGAGHAG